MSGNSINFYFENKKSNFSYQIGVSDLNFITLGFLEVIIIRVKEMLIKFFNLSKKIHILKGLLIL